MSQFSQFFITSSKRGLRFLYVASIAFVATAMTFAVTAVWNKNVNPGASKLGGSTEDFSKKKNNAAIIPTAFADVPHSTDGLSSCSDCDGGDCCLPGSAKIETVDGMLAIKDIAVGTQVVSFDHTTETWVTSTVGELVVHDGTKYPAHNFEEYPLYRISYHDAESNIKTLVITGNHPVYVPSSQTYQQVEDVSKGTSILTEAGVTRVEDKEVVDPDDYFETEMVVFNLHMEAGPANYVADGILIHNRK